MEERCPDVAGEHPVERGDLELRGRAEERDPGVVDQDVHLADVVGQARHVGRVAEAGSDEAGLAASGSDLFDRLGATGGIATVNDDLRAVPRKLQRDRATDPRRRARHQRPLPFEVVFIHR